MRLPAPAASPRVVSSARSTRVVAPASALLFSAVLAAGLCSPAAIAQTRQPGDLPLPGDTRGPSARPATEGLALPVVLPPSPSLPVTTPPALLPDRGLLVRAAEDPTALRAQAQEATGRRDWTVALPRWRALEIALPDDAELFIESARAHGYADRNADAAQRWQRVIELAPQRRNEVLAQLAWQTLWSGHPVLAQTLFEEIAANPKAYGDHDGFDAWNGLAQARLARDDNRSALTALQRAHNLRPNDRPTRQRLARVYGWLDRYDEAIAAWSGLADDDEQDLEARYALAQARNFAGHHRAAAGEYRTAFTSARLGGIEIPERARLDYARALRWGGFDERAHAALTGLELPDAVWLRTWRTQREVRPWITGAYEAARDRDRLEIRSLRLEGGMPVGTASTLRVFSRRGDISDRSGDFNLSQVGIGMRTRFGSQPENIGTPWDRGPVWVSANVATNRYGSSQSVWNPASGNVRVRWMPSDLLGLEAEYGREIIESVHAIQNRVKADVLSLGADWRVRPGTLLTAAIAALRFDDGNMRTRVNLRAEQLVLPRPRLALGVEAMAFRASDPASDTVPGRGYWNPQEYAEARVYAALSHDAHPWDFQAKVGVGTSRETDGWGNRSTGQPNLLEVAVGYDIRPELRMRAWAGGSGGSIALGSGGSGYWRRAAGVSLTGWF